MLSLKCPNKGRHCSTERPDLSMATSKDMLAVRPATPWGPAAAPRGTRLGRGRGCTIEHATAIRRYQLNGGDLGVCLKVTATRRLRAQPPAAAAGEGGTARLPPAVAAFLDAFNQRSVDGMAACLAASAQYTNFSYMQPFTGKAAVRSALASLVGGAPPDWRLAVLDATCDAAGSAAAVVFCMHDGAGRAVPLSKGVAFYRLDEAGLISSITEASEQVFKVPDAALPAIGAAAPLLQALGSGPLGGLLAGAQPAASNRTPARQALASPAASASRDDGGAGAGSTSSSSSFASSRTWQQQASSGAPSGSTAQQPPGGSRPGSRPSVAPPAAVQASGSPATPGEGGGSEAIAGSSSGGPASPGVGAIAGTWIKDVAASDLESYGRACDLLQLGGLQKTTAMQLIEGLELEQSGAQVAVRFLTVVPFFSVTESYRLGAPTTMGRRDLRRGSQQACAAALPDGSLRVSISWGEPNAGSVEEVYRLVGAGSAGGTLECLSTVSVAAGSVTTRTVYTRSAGGWTPRLKWNPLYAAMGGGR